jgi:hypothetical protein
LKQGQVTLEIHLLHRAAAAFLAIILRLRGTKAKALGLSEIPDVKYSKCSTMLTVGYVGKNYGCKCAACGCVFELGSIVPDWREDFEYCGVATPNEYSLRRQNPEETNAQSRQPRRYGPPQRSRHAAAQPKLSGCAIPPPTYPSRCSESDHRHGPKASLPVLQAHQARTTVR